ncbi:MAG: alpha/beta hydrolase [Pseudomonadota bacterium]|nr:alpha/beta hydrolase [Pseudomonadota bacterium]
MTSSPILTPEAIESGYNNRAAVADHQQWLDQWLARSESAREALRPSIDIRYGSGPKETLDLYVPMSPARGTLMFIHGGWWRTLDKSDHAFVAPAFVDAGLAVAVINYDLCPDVTIATVIEQCRHAILWVMRDGRSRGAPMPLVIAGHSAGGHLTAMMYSTNWRGRGLSQTPFAGGVSLSGVHDLEPLVQFSHNVDFRLDEAEARRLSPVDHHPLTDAPLLLAVGADETSEFRRQTDLLWDAWPQNHPPGVQSPLRIANRHHYSVVLDYTDPASSLTQATLALFPR